MLKNKENLYIGLSGFTASSISTQVNEILYKSRMKPKYEVRKVFTILSVAGAIIVFTATCVASLPLFAGEKIDKNYYNVYSDLNSELPDRIPTNKKQVILALDGSTTSSASSAKRVLLTDPGGDLPSGKVTLKVIDNVRPNPFLPYKDYSQEDDKFDLIEPPEALVEGSDAERVMDTAVSGILYDPYNPSAIINVEGTEYLVKRGDSINNYHVLDINNKQVVVKLGKNVYRAGVGEILTEGSINPSNIPNLEKKFGGANVN